MDTQRTARQSAFIAILLCLFGVLVLLMRLNWRTIGGFQIAVGFIWMLDAMLASRGVPRKRRFWLRLALGVAGACIVALLWRLGIK